jgi:hypothetical protein
VGVGVRLEIRNGAGTAAAASRRSRQPVAVASETQGTAAGHESSVCLSCKIRG